VTYTGLGASKASCVVVTEECAFHSPDERPLI
jgi:hypothetical protein